MLPESFVFCLANFQQCFTNPSYRRFLTIVTGWILCTSKHTITGVIRAAAVVGKREHGGYYRFFNTARWNTDEVGLCLMTLFLTLYRKSERVNLTVDDTLARHTGKHIAAGGMHRDPLLSTGKNPYFHFGHNWVVVAMVLDFARWGKTFSLPVLIRLYRWVKGRLGFEDPQNRKEKAVERTAPMALWVYSLVVYWYAHWSRGRRVSFRKDPWNSKKQKPTFADMLATLGRESWTIWISDRAVKGRFDRKYLTPLLEIAANG